MPYDIHVVRTADLHNAAKLPISKADIDRLIAADSALSWSASDFVEFREKSGNVARYAMICWKGTPFCYWLRSEIIANGLEQNQFAKLIEIAGRLNARVIGDDGGNLYTS